MSLRLRLTLLYSLLFAGLLAAFGIIVYSQTSTRLYSSLDDTLQLRADRILTNANEPDDTADGTFQVDQSVLDEIATPGVYVEVLSDDGTVIAKSSNLAAPIPVATKRNVRTTGQSLETHVAANHERVRVLYADAQTSGGQRATLLVARSLHPTDEVLGDIRYLLIGGGIAVLLVANGLAYVLAAPALRPVGQATRTAEEIKATGDFSRRIAGEKQHGEIGELVRTLNEMIAKVESSLDAHKSFLADSSHELRRPLAVVRGNLEVLTSDTLPDEERRHVIAETEQESRRMSRILSDLLLLSQVDARLILQQRATDLTALLDAVAAHECQRFPDRQIDVTMPNGPVRIVADEQRVTQLFENLIENAALYSEPGGPIQVSVQRNGRFAVAEVRDHGAGMSHEEARHAFERFFRGSAARRRHRDGSGLGLAIVRHIAEAHGGRVSLAASPSGCTVRVELPLTPGNQ